MKQLVLNLDNIVNYLLDKNLINNEVIVEGDLRIIDESRRNRNFKVMRTNGPSYLVKQSLEVDVNSRNTLEKESKFYSYIMTSTDSNNYLKEFIPKFYFMDDKNKILVIEYIKNSISLNQYIRNSRSYAISLQPFYLLGKNMALYHIFFEKNVKKNDLDFIHKKIPPSMFFVRPPPSIFIQISSANLELIKEIQKYPELTISLESVYRDWKVQTLVHGDIKWDNVILSNIDSKTFNTYIVDWELAEFGDPAWDIAGIFHDFITYWIGFISSSEITNIKDLNIPTNTPFDTIKDYIRTFWVGYIRTKNLSGRESNELLLKSTRYCASRLIQKTYEMHQSLTSISNMAFYMIQVSYNIMKDTEEAIIHLFGIPFRLVG